MGSGGDLLQDGVDILEDLLIRKPENHIILVFEIGISALIVGAPLLGFVNVSINLDHKPLSQRILSASVGFFRSSRA